MKIDSVKKYLASPLDMPYFLFISDLHYAAAMKELSFMGLDHVRTSEFCGGGDKLPDIDQLLTYIQGVNVNGNGKKFVVTGLGEFLAFRGSDEAERTLSRLKDLKVGSSKVVLLLRGLSLLIEWLQTDPRFDDRRFGVVDKAECNLSVTLAAPSIGLSALSGFKVMLAELENGRLGNVAVNTAINLDESIFTVHQINNAYEGIKFLIRDFALESTCGNDTRWATLLVELTQNNSSLDKVFNRHDFGNNLEPNFYDRIATDDYHNWLFFIYLKSQSALQNGYLCYVLDHTSRFEDFVRNILNLIIDIRRDDNRFSSFYRERKALVDKFPEPDIADFIVNNRTVISESIYKLTDRTRVEREEIIDWISKNGMIPELDGIYPILASYLRKYVFKGTELAELLTEYFDDYKWQKLSGKINQDFLSKVDDLALKRVFNRLPTRNEIIDCVDKNDTLLYWLDALGVEYLGLIEDLAQRRGLSVRINVARAELPTITAINRDFFDAWQGRKVKNNELDDTKHGEISGYNYSHESPIHLAKELDIITVMIDKAATELALKKYKRFLIVSDHGASRLAVLRRKEEKYHTDTTGEHSGRCCKQFQPHDLSFVAEENGYLVLADYGRFKGSRAANVEVHGGASLEEVVIPVIELFLKDQSITVKLVDESVIVDFRTGTEIKLFFNTPVQDVSVVFNGHPYTASQFDTNHYSVKLPDIKRAGDYFADVFAGDNLIGKIIIKAEGKSGKVNNAFDNLF